LDRKEKCCRRCPVQACIIQATHDGHPDRNKLGAAPDSRRDHTHVPSGGCSSCVVAVRLRYACIEYGHGRVVPGGATVVLVDLVPVSVLIVDRGWSSVPGRRVGLGRRPRVLCSRAAIERRRSNKHCGSESSSIVRPRQLSQFRPTHLSPLARARWHPKTGWMGRRA
jgi:hypothetical protein